MQETYRQRKEIEKRIRAKREWNGWRNGEKNCLRRKHKKKTHWGLIYNLDIIFKNPCCITVLLRTQGNHTWLMLCIPSPQIISFSSRTSCHYSVLLCCTLILKVHWLLVLPLGSYACEACVLATRPLGGDACFT